MSEQLDLVPKARGKKATPLTEGQLVERLRARYEGESGNGPSGCLIHHVRDAAGFDAARTIDALGLHFWPSRGMLIDAYECKSSRSDWQRELDNPAKADRFCALADRFYVVIGRADLAKVDEVPPDWGLLVPHGDKLKEVKPAVVLHADSPAVETWLQQAGGRRAKGPRPLPPGFDRSFLIALIRAMSVTVDIKPQLRAVREEGYRAGQERAESSHNREIERLRQRDEERSQFEQALGLSVSGWRQWGIGAGDVTPRDIGAALRKYLDGEVETTRLRDRLNAIARDAAKLADEARAQVAALDAMGPQGATA